MVKRYDPIMCMMVDDSVKTKDVVSNVKVGNKYKVNGKEYKVIRANISQNIVSLLSDNFERLDMKFDEFMKKANDSASALDKAIKVCDAVEVETSEWSFSSGKSRPSGLGNWWFKIGTEEKNFYGNWSNAKAEAIKYAKEKGINRISLMT